MSSEVQKSALPAAEGWQRGRQRWPDLRLALGAYERAVSTCSAPDSDAALCHEDLFLATACATKIPGALEALECSHFSLVRRLLSGFANLNTDEFLCAFREHLFVSRGSRAPRIASYRGSAPLSRWLRVTATRYAIDLSKRERGELFSAEDISALPAPAGDPELAYLKELYRNEFQAAFRRAASQLSAKERNLLRYHLIDRLGIDPIAALYKVHRATVARWLERARTDLARHTHVELMKTLEIQASEVDSILRLIDSQLEASVGQALSA